jgi:hypothetical protein
MFSRTPREKLREVAKKIPVIKKHFSGKGKTMNVKTSKLLTLSILMIATVVLSMPVETRAQWGERQWKRYNRRQVEDIIKRLEASSNQFRSDFDRWLDSSKMDGSEREDKYNARVKRYENAFDELRNDFDRKDKWWETREKVKDALDAARPVGQLMRDRRIKNALDRRWSRMRVDLNRLASTYQLARV